MCGPPRLPGGGRRSDLNFISIGQRIGVAAANVGHVHAKSEIPDLGNVDATGGKKLRAGAHLAMEFNIAHEIPEWDGKKVWIMQEDPVHLTEDGWRFFVPRQEAFYLVQ